MRTVKNIGGVLTDTETEKNVRCAFNRDENCKTDCAACVIEEQENIIDKVHCLRFPAGPHNSDPTHGWGLNDTTVFAHIST